MTERRPYRRESEESRREALILAALELVAEGGLEAATVRSIADRAGVTPGLIRHYFSGKEDLTRAAYRHMMEQMTADNVAVLETAPDCPLARLTAFVTASLTPPVMQPLRLAIWAGFLQLVRSDAAMRAVHEQTYLGYRDILENLIAALPRPASDAARCRSDAIACNAVIDGLWMEGSALPDNFASGELVAIGLHAIGAILGVTLAGAPPAPAAPPPTGAGPNGESA
ncbi:MAG: TetR family transcriptional regulator C-terminal domain-containing protein [Rhodobacteraceae bacterium]|uniref:TetR/AcrR family transcriptional regulator n=1 Tax=Tabrizicola sp. SY72 TaxID=2741673 RepID=UPI0015719781|nr:TetR family transcriptional regulator C-terminal domain-containing protein [Tabrizicola sp. SY72]MBL9055875.1 TetR family transcriptional regulator C-terminal domain-containing protein [Paracoccaceae bacterium]NTT85500.1 TetR family transcriptional regulator C-terminal domain-containing protein [Tabrizicola sp. SY72]